MPEYTSATRSALAAHADRVERYRQGKLTDAEFTPIRLSYGLYAQLEHTSYMQRIKIPGGQLAAEQLERIAELAQRYGRGLAHVTTRQDIQFHWVPLEGVSDIYERLDEVGITTRGTCADSVRNVTACPHSGLLDADAFDVVPYAKLVTDHFLFHPLNLTLPRKFKIAFSSCASDCAQGLINDVGLYARSSGGEEGFSVWAGGGLGAQPFLARRFLDFVPARDVLIVCEAIVRIQHRWGERANRRRARMKYLVRRLGEARFKDLLATEMKSVDGEMGERLRVRVGQFIANYAASKPRHKPKRVAAAGLSAEAEQWWKSNARAQREQGYFLLSVLLPLGDFTTAQGRALAAIAQRYGSGELRTTNDQNLAIPWIPADLAGEVYSELQAIGLTEPFAERATDVVSCPGGDYCSLAITRSMQVAGSIRDRLKRRGPQWAELGHLRIRVSGCPNSCGQHHVSDIGLTGVMVKNWGGQERPHYIIMVGGSVGEGSGAVARRLGGRYPEEGVAAAVCGLLEFFSRQRQSGESLAAFAARCGEKKLSEVAQAACEGDGARERMQKDSV